MPDPTQPVKREYDASGRRARADQRRDAALDAARELFLARGYLATTVEALAAGAGVSAATIYKSYGGKAGMARELCARTLAGEGDRPAEERSDELRSTAGAHEVLAGWAALVAEVSPRVSPLLLVLRTAAEVDGDAAALWAELDSARLARMAMNARDLIDRGLLREGVSAEVARDVLWFCTSPELYDLLIVQRRWPLQALRDFVEQTMAAALL